MVWTEAPARAKVAGHPLLPIPTATASLPDSTRDLKPANVKVKADGTVKVLDFGLAKAFQPEASGAGASESPTISLTAAATQMGMVIGTAAYMAPEQASGKAVDKRADVWAFGVVLYEMLTGTRPFVGDDVSKTLAHVIAIDPDWDALPDELPPMLGSFLRGCLSKSPKQRVHDVADVRLAMEGAFDTKAGTPEDQPVAATLRVWQRPVPAVVGVLVVAVVSGLAVRGLMRPVSEGARPPTRVSLSLPATDRFGNLGLALSPDGRSLVYVAVRDGTSRLFRRAMGQLEPVPIPGTEAGPMGGGGPKNARNTS